METEKIYSLQKSDIFDKGLVQKHFKEADIRLLKLILSQIKGDTEDYLFDFSRLEEVGFDLISKEDEVIGSLKSIANFYLDIKNGYGDHYKLGLIDNKFTIDQETKILSIKVHKELIPHLNSLKEQYSTLQLETKEES